MLQKIKAYIIEHNLLKEGQTVVLGVSGGPDSMALLHILVGLRTELGIQVVAAHLNHGLRAEAGDEEQLVSRVCHDLRVSFFSAQRDILALAGMQKKSLEETGRKERYRFFYEVCQREEAHAIATAHHQDDVAETVLIHLLRGSGIKGLRGILPRNGVLIRPLLCVGKEEILDYLHQQRLVFCQDQSNQDLRYTRNRIRHCLLPMLRDQFNGRIVQNLNQLADIAREENQWLEEMAAAAFEELVEQPDENTLIVDNLGLQVKPTACQRRLLARALACLGGEGEWELKDIEKIRDLQTKTGSHRMVPLKKGLVAKKVYDHLVLSNREAVPTDFCHKLDQIPGSFSIPEIGQRFSLFLTDPDSQVFDEAMYLDYDRLEGHQLFLRSRRPGDRIRPAGGRGSKKVKEYFIDRKLPWEERDRVPLLASDHEIHAIMGCCVAEPVRVRPQSQRILVIKKESRADDAVTRMKRD
ncbi:MAG TPA: tRNA lysidine(34) synthetase TilS [Syntrophomonadaceae bacterium]|nr:tRNA lysidine(34) synthetase TilS [Syntrophomonadaceae bacterium]